MFLKILRGRSSLTATSGRYYKHMTIVNVDSSIVSKLSSELNEDTRAVIYDRNVFIIHSTANLKKL
jgi:hypothetical protein